jgi:DNA-binding response OmpR family regulator
MHVLLCEDDDLIASGICAGLTAQGFTVDRVGNASQARQMLQAAQFDVMILDLGLPDEDGLKLLRRLRQQGEALPVLVLTRATRSATGSTGCRPAPTTTCSSPSTCARLARLHTLVRRVAGRAVNVIEHGPLCYDPSSCRPPWPGSRSTCRGASSAVAGAVAEPGGCCPANSSRTASTASATRSRATP